MLSPRLLLSVVIVLLAVEYSNARCLRGYSGRETEGLNDPKFVLGRKVLEGLFPTGKGKSADTGNSYKLPETESEGIQKHPEEDKGAGSGNGNKGDMFVEAADDLAKLMRKDYSGAGRPRRKPPINNHEPNN